MHMIGRFINAIRDAAVHLPTPSKCRYYALRYFIGYMWPSVGYVCVLCLLLCNTIIRIPCNYVQAHRMTSSRVITAPARPEYKARPGRRCDYHNGENVSCRSPSDETSQFRTLSNSNVG